MDNKLLVILLIIDFALALIKALGVEPIDGYRPLTSL